MKTDQLENKVKGVLLGHLFGVVVRAQRLHLSDFRQQALKVYETNPQFQAMIDETAAALMELFNAYQKEVES